MRQKVIILGDSPTISSGTAMVVRQLAINLSDLNYDIYVIGLMYRGEPHEWEDKFQIISPIDFKNDYFGIFQTRMLCNLLKNDDNSKLILISVGDVDWYGNWIPNLPERDKFYWISAFPLDGIPLSKSWLPIIENQDYSIVYSQFAYDLVHNALPNKTTLKKVLHGCNTNEFYPLPKNNVEDFKKQLGLEDKWILGTVSRNQWRKNLPALVKAFSDFSSDKPDTMLYMHSCPKDVGWNLFELVDMYNLTGRVAFPPDWVTPSTGVDVETMNALYNAMDCMALSCGGEGVGLPLIESMAAGTITLSPDFSACPEYVVDRKIQSICIKDYICPVNPGRDACIYYGLVDNQDFVNKLNYIYYHPEVKEQIGQQGREYAVKNLQWKDKIIQVSKIIEEIRGNN